MKFNTEEIEKTRKLIANCSSFLNFATNDCGGDKEFMMKLAEINAVELNRTVLRLLKIGQNEIDAEIKKCEDWIDFLKNTRNIIP